MASLKLLRVGFLGLLLLALCALHPATAIAQTPAARTDYLGDPLPDGALYRLGTARLRHTGSIERLLFMDDGKSLIAVGKFDMPTAWEVETGKRIPTDDAKFKLIDHATGDSILVPAHPALWESSAFGRHGKTLVAVAGDNVTAWDVESGKSTTKKAEGLTDAMKPKRNATTQSVLVPFLDPLTGEEKQETIRLSDTRNAWKSWFLSDDGKHLTVRYGVLGEMPEVDTDDKSVTPNGQNERDWRIKLTIAGETPAIVAGWETVSSKDLKSGELVWRKVVCPPWESGRGLKTCRVDALALSPDGKIVASGTDSGYIELLDLATGERAGGSCFHPGFFYGPPKFVPGGKFILVMMGQEAVLWNLLEGKKVRGFGEDSDPENLFMSSDGQTILVGEWTESGNTCKVTLQDMLSGKRLWSLDDEFELFPEAQFSSDGQTVALHGRYIQGVTILSTKTGEKLRTFPPPDLDPGQPGKGLPAYRVNGVSPEMTIATETRDTRSIELWDPMANKKLWTWSMPADWREHSPTVHFVPGGKYVLAKLGRTDVKDDLFVLDAKSGKALTAMQSGRFDDVSPDGRFIACSKADGPNQKVNCLVRELPSGETTLKLDGAYRGLFSPDGKIFACCRGDFIEFHDLRTKLRLGSPRPIGISGWRHWNWDMAFSPSGPMVAMSSNNSTVIVWDAAAR